MDGSLRLLLVDDHDYVLTALAASLETYESVSVVGTAADPKEAVALCLQINPTVVITDLMLAGEDQGLTVIRELQQHCPSIPVIILTAYADKNNREKALAAGAADFFDKTDLTLDHLVATMRRIAGPGTI